jgi:tripartite-type tricarboxylate transporter receptor subunit TctC
VPTLHEAGSPLPELDPGTWWGVVAPAGIAADTAQKLNASMQAALADPELRERLAALNVDPIPSSAEEFRALIKNEARKWAELVARGRIRVE